MRQYVQRGRIVGNVREVYTRTTKREDNRHLFHNTLETLTMGFQRTGSHRGRYIRGQVALD